MNCNLYHHQGKWLMVDLGVIYGDDTFPAGVDVVMADTAFIEEKSRDIAGMLITHGHDDHIGAIPLLWHRLRCPIYATALTAELIRRKFDDTPSGVKVCVCRGVC